MATLFFSLMTGEAGYLQTDTLAMKTTGGTRKRSRYSFSHAHVYSRARLHCVFPSSKRERHKGGSFSDTRSLAAASDTKGRDGVDL